MRTVYAPSCIRFNEASFPIRGQLDFERWTVLSVLLCVFGLEFSDILLIPGIYLKFWNIGRGYFHKNLFSRC